MLRLRHSNGSRGTAVEVPHKCSKCKDVGYYEVWHDGYPFMRECECGKVQRQRIADRLKFAAVPKEFEGHTVGNFRTDCYSAGRGRQLAEVAKHLASQYVSQFQKIRETGKGLYFHSSTKGSGKTRLAVSIANDLITGQMVAAKFATTIQILDQIKSTWGEKSSGQDWAGQMSEQRLMDEIISVPVLVIDDIGAENPSGWVKERFYNILNGRMAEKKATIFTSNCRVEELGLEGRIVSRIEKMALSIEFPEESVRRAIARKENGDILDILLGK